MSKDLIFHRTRRGEIVDSIHIIVNTVAIIVWIILGSHDGTLASILFASTALSFGISVGRDQAYRDWKRNKREMESRDDA